MRREYAMKKRLCNVMRCIAAGLTISAVCGVPAGCSVKEAQNMLMADVNYPKAYSFDDYDERIQRYEENAVEDSFIDAVNGFSYRTASELLGEGKNVCYSPISLYYALAAATEGAQGTTREELLALLGEKNMDVVAEQSSRLYNILFRDNKVGKLLIHGSVWIDDSLDINDDYVNRLADKYYTESYHGDFASNKFINAMKKWVKDNTGGMEMEAEPDAGTVLTILNTVYFCDEWLDRFDKKLTKKDNFYLRDGSTVECYFMNSRDFSHYYAKGEGFTRSSLSFKNGEVMSFVLPDEGVDIRELIAAPEGIEEVLFGGEGSTGEVVWKIPKFYYDTELKLNDAISKLGVTSCFGEAADFSGIGRLDSGEGIFINEIKQNSHIEIDENGVVASAYTQIDYNGMALPDGRADMILDRPFLYAIADRSGVVIFVGVCENPGAK